VGKKENYIVKITVRTVDEIIHGIVTKYDECYEAIVSYDKSRRMSDIRKELIVELYRNGYGVDVIADVANRTRATVLYNLGHLSRCKEMAVPRLDPKRSRAWSKKED
jgi:hypothetical protein